MQKYSPEYSAKRKEEKDQKYDPDSRTIMPATMQIMEKRNVLNEIESEKREAGSEYYGHKPEAIKRILETGFRFNLREINHPLITPELISYCERHESTEDLVLLGALIAAEIDRRNRQQLARKTTKMIQTFVRDYDVYPESDRKKMTEEALDSFRFQVIEIRKHLGWSQKYLGKVSGIESTKLNRVENHTRKIKPEEVTKILGAFRFVVPNVEIIKVFHYLNEYYFFNQPATSVAYKGTLDSQPYQNSPPR